MAVDDQRGDTMASDAAYPHPGWTYTRMPKPLRATFDVAVAVADPAKLVAVHLPAPSFGRCMVAGAGKAGRSFAAPNDLPVTGPPRANRDDFRAIPVLPEGTIP